jgi:hypothetical protein
MVMDNQFRDWMTATIGVENVTGLSTDGYGGRTYASAKVAKARIEQVQELIMSYEGKEMVSRARLYVQPYTTSSTTDALTIGPTDRLTLPNGYNPLLTSSSGYLPPIINVFRHNDDSTGAPLMYWEVLL